ncbi:dipeptidase [Aurantimonas sp. MSK8Z-1]|uniref:dipeptidase n=1 Tax=Mangrovibrevibacter kandeliae TaxID=2968473 RepID=UPI002117AFDE|nr:dipeptidase [Aurantimonas sp. MSK8Z-1]MCW4117071.1 dipeptidase [Aurantimonas sp. MSK8Z-1]
MKPTLPVFDGHNDLLLRLLDSDDPVTSFLHGRPDGHIDMPRARAGGLAGGFFAVYVPSPDAVLPDERGEPPYDPPLPAPLALDTARATALRMIALLLQLERETRALAVCRSAAAIRGAMGEGQIAAILHMEGAEAIDADLDMLHVLHAAGLRSLGPVWSRPTIFGHGVPFRFPGSPDTGPGLTEVGERLVRACNALHILIDLSHLNEAGFWDVARISHAPLVATHSNVHALSPSARNLTDRQLDAIRDSGGMVGLNFATAFLRPDGRTRGDTELEVMVRHLDHLVARLGEGGVGFGSDFDGAHIPDAIGDAAGLPALFDALRQHGWDEAMLRRVAHENWLGLIERVIG